MSCQWRNTSRGPSSPWTATGLVLALCVALFLVFALLVWAVPPAFAGAAGVAEYWASQSGGAGPAGAPGCLPVEARAVAQAHGGYGVHGAPDGPGVTGDEGLVGAIQSISGTVTGPGGAPVVDMVVEAYDEYGDWTEIVAFTDANGDYTLEGLPPGSYLIGTWNQQGLVDEWYDDVVRSGNWSGEGATLVDVSAADATDKDFELAQGRSILGRVTRSGGTPLADVFVDVFDKYGEWLGLSTVTLGTGYYTIGGLAPGAYLIATSNASGYIDEWYDNIIYQGNEGGEGATLIDTASGDATGKNFQLAAGRSISGKVTRSGGAALEGVDVMAFDAEGNDVAGTSTAADGTYTIRGLLPGSYLLATSNYDGYIDEWYNNIVYQGNREGTGATPVDVTAVNATSKNFQLALGRTISGFVTGESGAPLEDVWLVCVDAEGEWVGSGWTGVNGGYIVTGLVAGSYRLWTENDQGYVDEWYGPGHVLRAGNDDAVGAAAVDVSSVNASGADFDLLRGSTISGAATDSGTDPLEGWDNRLEYFGSSGESYGEQWLPPEETSYESYALPPGTYYVRSWNEAGYIDVWYSGLPCETNEIGDADPVDLTAGNATGIDFPLLPGAPVIEALSPDFGSTGGGTEVEIWGRGFLRMGAGTGSELEDTGDGLLGAFSGVTFDGAPVAYTALSPNLIIAISPAHSAGPVQVQVSAAGGTNSDSADSQFTYLVPVGYSSLRGSDRFDTAIKISKAMFPGALPAGAGLVLAPGETFPEALCGAPLASAWGGPVLLTPAIGLNNGVKAEMLRLAPERVFCIGLSTTVVNQVKTAMGPGVTVTPIRGDGGSVYDMSRRVADALETKVGDMTGATAIITMGTLFPDAIGVSPLACANLWPIVLTQYSDNRALHANAAGALADLGITHILKVGTYATLPVGVTGLANLSGADRYVTNANVANWGDVAGGLAPTHTGLATGDKFPDALAAGPYLAQDSGVLLLSPLSGPLPGIIAGVIDSKRALIEDFSFIAMIEPVVGEVKALLP